MPAEMSSFYCRQRRLHANTVIIKKIFAYICLEAGQIWTKHGRGMGNGEKWSYKIFGEITPGVHEKWVKTNPFYSFFLSQVPHIVLVTSALPISKKHGTNTWIHVWMNCFVAKFWNFSIKGSLFVKKILWLNFRSFGQLSKRYSTVENEHAEKTYNSSWPPTINHIYVSDWCHQVNLKSQKYQEPQYLWGLIS